MDCHHKILWKISKDDRYSNLVLVTRDVHILIHATDENTIRLIIFQIIILAETFVNSQRHNKNLHKIIYKLQCLL
jgi:hypothetical protein